MTVTAYNKLFTAIGIDKLINFKAHHYPLACNYLSIEPLVIEGEVLPKQSPRNSTSKEANALMAKIRGIAALALPEGHAQGLTQDIDRLKEVMSHPDVPDDCVVVNRQKLDDLTKVVSLLKVLRDSSKEIVEEIRATLKA